MRRTRAGAGWPHRTPPVACPDPYGTLAAHVALRGDTAAISEACKALTMALATVCVYCGSSPGNDLRFTNAAAELGRTLARRDIELVYGGGKVGLMGVVADASLEAGGSVIGIITEALVEREIAHTSVSELIVVSSMHARKAAMADRADAFLMLPGGFGTLEEFFEAVTWTQLGVHEKPCGVMNVAGFFDPLLSLIKSLVTARFVHPEHARMVLAHSDPGILLDLLAEWRPVQIEKWLDRSDR